MKHAGLTTLFGVAALGGCLQSSAPTPPPDPRDSARPADVQLPPVPNLDIVDVPAIYEDGSRSIAGLIRDREALRGSDVHVTGILHSLYACEIGAVGVDGGVAELAAEPDAGTSVAVRPGCLRPHFYIVDSLRSRQRVLVTGYDAGVYEPQLSPGRRVVITGRFDQQTRGFISTEEGLVIASEISGDGIAVPPPEAVAR